MPIIKYRTDCTCGGEMAVWEVDETQDPESNEYVIDLEMFGEMVLNCDSCRDRAYVPGIYDHIEDLDS